MILLQLIGFAFDGLLCGCLMRCSGCLEFGVWLPVILVFAIGSVWIVFGDNSDNWLFWCFLLGCWLVWARI